VLLFCLPRPRKDPGEESSRDLVRPIILKQASWAREEEDEGTEDEDETCKDVIKIGEEEEDLRVIM